MTTIQATFIDPSDSEKPPCVADLELDAIPAFCIGKLLEKGFMPPPPAGAPYGLVTGTGIVLEPNSSLRDAGIDKDTTFSIVPSHQGAEPDVRTVLSSAEGQLL